MITCTNISDITLLPEEARRKVSSSLQHNVAFPDPNTRKRAYLDHNIACFNYTSFTETAILWLRVHYGDQTWLDTLAARFPYHKLQWTEDREVTWVRIEKTGETPVWMSSRVLHALRFLTEEFGQARVQEGNPPTTWKELFRVCFRYSSIKYHLPWNTRDRYWNYLFGGNDGVPFNLAYREVWQPELKNVFYDTIDYLSSAVWDFYHIGSMRVKSRSSLLLHKGMPFSTMLPMKKIITHAARKRRAALEGGKR